MKLSSNLKMCLFVVFATCFLFSNFLGASTAISPLEKWQRMSTEVDSWTDALGLGIDEPIKPIVIALNISEVPTIASCGGHLDRALPYPWVDLDQSSSVTESLAESFHELQRQAEALEQLLSSQEDQESYAGTLQQRDAVWKELHILADEFERRQMESLLPLYTLLDEFYRERKVSYDRSLIIDLRGARLLSIGACRQILRSEEEKGLKLEEYRQEMEDFAAFLKNKSFQTDMSF